MSYTVTRAVPVSELGSDWVTTSGNYTFAYVKTGDRLGEMLNFYHTKNNSRRDDDIEFEYWDTPEEALAAGENFCKMISG